MNTPPGAADLSPLSIRQTLIDHWHLPGADLSYLPLGFGSHHWLAEFPESLQPQMFVTADAIGDSPDACIALTRSMTTAWRLYHKAGLAEVVAPLPTVMGDLVKAVNDRWVMAVFPFLPLLRGEWGAFQNEEDRLQALRLVARIHEADGSAVPTDLPVRENFLIPYREQLFERLENATGEWSCGPHGDATRLLLERNLEVISTGFDRHDHLVALALRNSDDWVVTHGEPHGGNILRRSDSNQMAIVDWDTCAFAPRERDLWQLFPPDSTSIDDLQVYLEETGLSKEAISDNRLALYRLHWDLAEIAVYTHWFASPHEDSEDMRVGWGGLVSSIELLSGHVANG